MRQSLEFGTIAPYRQFRFAMRSTNHVAFLGLFAALALWASESWAFHAHLEQPESLLQALLVESQRWKSLLVVGTASALLFVHLKASAPTDANGLFHESLIDPFVQHSNDVFWVVSPDWRQVRYISPSFERVWGRPCIGLLRAPLSWLDAVHPDDREAVVETFENAWKHSGDAVAFPEYRVIRPDGTVRCISARAYLIRDNRGRMDHVAGIAEDITERRATEQALKESEARYRDRYNRTPALLHSIDQTGRITAVSDLWLEKTGFAREEMIGRCLSEFMTEESRDRYLTTTLDRLLSAGEVRDLSFSFVRKNGETFDGEMSAVSEIDPDGKSRGSRAVTLDVSERNLAEEQFRQAQKFQAIGRLTGGMAHDFNNLLAVISLNLTLLRESVESGEVDADFVVDRVMQMARTADKAAALTHSLLAFSRRQTLDKKVLDLRDAFAGIEPVLRQAVGASVNMDFRIDNAALRIRTDEAQFGSALLNLAINARDAMPRGGQLTIAAGIDAHPPAVLTRGGDLGGGPVVRVVVSDTGIGIPETMLERIMEPFFTTKKVNEGTGLGLSMVYGFVKQCGGHIDITSTEGAGTSVALYFPLVVEEAAETA